MIIRQKKAGRQSLVWIILAPTRKIKLLKETIVGIKNLAYPFCAFQRGSYGAFVNSLLPLYLATFTNNTATIGFLVTISAFEGATIPLFIGPLSDRTKFSLGARKIYILVGSLITGILLFLFPLAHTLPLLIVFIISAGFSNSIATAPHFAMISQNSSVPKRSQTVALIGIAALGGQIVTSILAIIFWGKTINGFTFLALALLFFIPAVPLLIFSRDRKSENTLNEKLNIHAIKMFFNNKTRNIYMLSQFVLWFGINSTLPFFTLFVKNYLLLTQQKALLFYLVIVAASGIFALPFALIAKKGGEVNIFRIGMLFLLAAGILGIFAKEIPEFLQYTVALCAGVGNAATTVFSFSILSKLVPEKMHGAAGGIQSFLIAGFAPVAAIISGKVISLFGYPSMFAIMATMTAFAIVLLSLVSRRGIDGAEALN